jgi:hypothetical protein
MKKPVFVAGVICLVFAAAALWIFTAARAYAEQPEPVKDWCYSYVSGQSMPMEYCEWDQ